MRGQRETSAVASITRSLRILEEVQTTTNAFTHVLADHAMEEAEGCDRTVSRGPLHGVPIVIKELFDVAGVPTTGGCSAFEGRVAETDSAVVRRLRSAGAIVVAKSNQHEMACGATGLLSSFGAIRNPWDAARIAGGSSSGSAVAVATDVVSIAMGSDTGGSIRIPSSFCGTTGLKVTHGAISLRGAMPLVPSLDSAGPIARTAAECLTVFNVLRDVDDDRSPSVPRPDGIAQLHGLRIALLRRFCALSTPEVRAAVDAAADVLTSLGAIVEEVDGPDPQEAWDAVGPIFVTEFAAQYPELAEDDRAHPEVRAQIAAGLNVSGVDYLASAQRAGAARRHFESMFAGADCLLAPATPFPAPRADELDVDLGGSRLDVRSGGPARLTIPINVAALPALSFPVGPSRDGLPIGAQLVGPRSSEQLLCAVGTAYQQATEWHLRVPAAASRPA